MCFTRSSARRRILARKLALWRISWVLLLHAHWSGHKAGLWLRLHSHWPWHHHHLRRCCERQRARRVPHAAYRLRSHLHLCRLLKRHLRLLLRVLRLRLHRMRLLLLRRRLLRLRLLWLRTARHLLAVGVGVRDFEVNFAELLV